MAQKIADTVDACPGLPILEVGPGMGVLTQFLLPKERELKVVEVDYESVAYLREAYPQLEEHIIEDDFLKMNLTRLFGGRPFVLTGNYPYNISSQIFFKMLDNKDLIPCCTGMIQKEVAERMMTRNDTHDLGCDERLFKQVVKTTFNQRRKTLRNSIKPLVGKDCPLTQAALFDRRPEQLSVQEFVELTNRVKEYLNNGELRMEN